MEYNIESATAERNVVEAWSSKRLPFEPKGWLKDFRSELATAICGLRASSEDALQATYVSESRERCDAENVLFYNVGSRCFSQCARRGICFIRSYTRAPLCQLSEADHYYRYEMVDLSNSKLSAFRPVATLLGEFRKLGAVKPETIWYALRSGQVLWARVSEQVLGDFGMSIQIEAPEGNRPNLAGLVKVLFDGAISALHTHNGALLDIVVDRLSGAMGLDAGSVSRLLMENPCSPLGERRLIWPHKVCTQWNPADERCVAGELLLTSSSGTNWRIKATLFEIARGTTERAQNGEGPSIVE